MPGRRGYNQWYMKEFFRPPDQEPSINDVMKAIQASKANVNASGGADQEMSVLDALANQLRSGQIDIQTARQRMQEMMDSREEL